MGTRSSPNEPSNSRIAIVASMPPMTGTVYEANEKENTRRGVHQYRNPNKNNASTSIR